MCFNYSLTDLLELAAKPPLNHRIGHYFLLHKKTGGLLQLEYL